MPETKKTIRRIQPAVHTAVDDARWPTNIALLVLAGVTGTLVVMAGGFDDPRLLHNGWLRLATLTATLIALGFAANTLCPRRARRLQTAVLLSLILHTLLAVFLYQQQLRRAELDEPLPSPIEAPELLDPQYVEVTDPTTPRPFEEPVAASVDTDIAETLDVSRSDMTRREPIEALATVEPQESLPRATSPERQLARAAPHQSDTLSRLSRQTREEVAQSSPVELARSRPPRPMAEPSPVQPTAELARTRPDPLPADATAEPEERTIAESASQPARLQPSREEPRIAQTQRAPRQSTSAEATPAEPEELPDIRRVAEAESPTSLQPDAEAAPRQTAQQSVESPEVRPEMSVAIPESRPQRERTELPAEPELSLARTPERSRDRDAAEISAEASPLAASRRPSDRTTEAGEGELQSQPTTLARASRPDPAAEPQVDPSELAGGTQVAGTPHTASRSREQQDPSITAQIASAEPRRTLRPADAVASPAEADAALAANASVPQEPTIEPSQAAIARANAGVLGGETGRNLADDLPSTPQQSAPQPSAAARRPTATQDSTGPALSPSASVQIARAVSEADAPVLGAAAVPVETPESAGSAEPSRVVVSSGATVERSQAAAPRAPVVAAEGTSSADLGTEQRVPDAGQRRAGGGGQAEITLAAALPVRRRIAEGGGPNAAIDTSDIAELPSAPATSGQAAATRSPSIDAAETPGGRAAPATIVHAEPLEGGATIASTAGELAPSNLQRLRAANTAEGLQPGGGISSPRRRFVDGSAVAPDVAVAINIESPATDPVAIGRPRGPAPSTSASVARARTGARRSPDRSSETASAAAGSADRTIRVAAPADRGTRRAAATIRPEQQFATAAAPRAIQTAALPQVETSLSDLPQTAASSPAGGLADGPASRRDADSPLGRAELAVAVSIDEPVHEGGLAIAPAETAGSLDRRAQPHSALVRIEPDRFLRRRAGGVAALGGDVRATAPAFARRTRRNNEPTPRSQGQPSAKTEAAIELGLVYLARHQHPDGRWSLEYSGVDFSVAPQERPSLQADTAATGLALLAFLGAGYDHYDDKYRDVIDRGLRFLVENQKDDGDLYLPEDNYSNQFNHFYSHGIASIALCEAYGMTGDPALREPAQRALDFIVASQHPNHGGWRYAPGGVAFSSDLSVTGWQVMALKSGELAGLDVPEKTYAEVRRFLAECVAPGSGGSRYVYNPWVARAPDEEQRRGARPSTVMTAVGVLLDLYLGSNRDQAALARGADHLLANLPTQNPEQKAPAIHTIGNPHRDTYYWYYATLVMFHMKGEYWKTWNETLHPLLVSSQTQHGALAGSWNPHKPVRDQWASQAGRLYVTTMNLLSLEVYYRHLPLYEATGR